MPASDAQDPVTHLDDLLAPFHDAFKPRARWRVGTEAEKFGVRLADGAPLPFQGPDGVQTVLHMLAERHGWSPQKEHEAGEVISLRRGEASITLEPGGQLELSGAPLSTVHQACAEVHGHMSELRQIGQELGVAWLGVGFHPFAKQEDLPWVPKLRYSVMREYLPTKGRMALDMMRRTCTVQANFDYADERDAVRKLRTALAWSPIVTALFANSPFHEGAVLDGVVSRRARVWLDVDPDRTGLLPFAWAEDFSIQNYVEWALDVPMFAVKRGGKLLPNTGQTFRAFMTDGFQGATATRYDWETHLNTLFPEVRIKKILEVRSADGQPTNMICALPALTKGFLYDAEALDQAEAAVSGLTHEDVAAAREPIARLGFEAEMAGKSVLQWARELVAIADGGLHRLGALNRRGDNETIHLRPLKALLDAAQTPAEKLLAQIDPSKPLLEQVLEHARV